MQSKATATEYRDLAEQVDENLNRDILAMWYPRAVDEADGGFHQNYAENWSPIPDTQKGVVYQSRLTWLAAQAALRYPEQQTEYHHCIRQGLEFLEDKLWDNPTGGLFWALEGDIPARGGEKACYGMAFAIYAASAAYLVTHDPRAIDLAVHSFKWLERHAHDDVNGGYYESLTRSGDPILAVTAASAIDPVSTPYGHKSMNTHIHLLEAFTALHEVWPVAQLKTRLEELFYIVRDKIVSPAGFLTLVLKPDWTPVAGLDSYGHDVETAYLLVEAAHALGIPDDRTTWRVARGLVDHALKHGWDTEHGGFFDHGYADGAPTITDKIWWVQAEGLNALLTMHVRYGQEDFRYWLAFIRQWDFIRRRQIDHIHRGWFESVTLDGTPKPGNRKSDGWTECYHQGRAMLNVSKMLEQLAGPAV